MDDRFSNVLFLEPKHPCTCQKSVLLVEKLLMSIAAIEYCSTGPSNQLILSSDEFTTARSSIDILLLKVIFIKKT